MVSSGLVGLVYALAMGLTLIYLGKHYLVDILARLVLALAAGTVPAAAGHALARSRWSPGGLVRDRQAAASGLHQHQRSRPQRSSPGQEWHDR